MSNINVIFTSSDNIIEVRSLLNELTGANLNAATVTVTLKDSTGTNVPGDTWPKTMAYVTGSNGVYRATLGYALPLTADARYTATLVADAGAGLRRTWTMECVARNSTT